LPAHDAGRLPLAVDPEGPGRRADPEQFAEMLAGPAEGQVGGQATGLMLEPRAEAAVEAERGIGMVAARGAGAT